MSNEQNKTTELVWQGPARSHNADQVTFIVAADPNGHDWHVETSSGERPVRLGKGAYFFNGKQFETDDLLAP